MKYIKIQYEKNPLYVLVDDVLDIIPVTMNNRQIYVVIFMDGSNLKGPISYKEVEEFNKIKAGRVVKKEEK